jgi:putative SOS response-associated peptidase YedK
VQRCRDGPAAYRWSIHEPSNHSRTWIREPRETLPGAVHVFQRVGWCGKGARLVRRRRRAAFGVFAGVWTTWTSVRKAREGEVTVDCFGFLTTDANSTVGAIHPMAMPVILTTAE